MAKKLKGRVQTPRPRSQRGQRTVAPRRWRRKLVLGGVVLVLLLGAVGLLRFLQQQDVASRLQGIGVEKHYTHGPAGAPVLVKEFSDYT